MKQNKQLKFNQGEFALYDANTMPYQDHKHMAHFALTDALITLAGETSSPFIHFWQTSPIAILGMMDTRITHFGKALEVLESYNHGYMVRNSGGLAVVGDPGVLNVSLIYPSLKKRISIDAAYQLMLGFIRETFYPHFPQTIAAYEITNSYCFGDFDLSINGRKIAGISQRRIQNGIAIMLYISVNGDQQRRAEMLKEFYEVGLDGSEPVGRYPEIHPGVMTTLEEAYNTSFSVPEVKEMMLTHFNWKNGQYTKDIDGYFQSALEKMYHRNARVFGENFVKGY